MRIKDSELKWHQVEERVIFRNKFVGLRNDLVKRPDGIETEFVVVENKDFAVCVCQTPQNDLVLVRQYRYPWQTASWELPSGIIDPGESSESAAIREIREETGYTVDNLEFILRFHPFGIASGWGYVFFARLNKDLPSNLNLDDNEFLITKNFSKAQVVQLIESISIIHAPSLLGIQLAINRSFI
jgi:ADP-ribose pyrophosphatase